MREENKESSETRYYILDSFGFLSTFIETVSFRVLMSWKASLSRSIQELRLQCCQHSVPSTGMRAFIQSQYPILKVLNPELPILVRESPGCQSRLSVRADFGVENHALVEGMNQEEIERELYRLVKEAQTLPKSAESGPRKEL